MAVAGRTKFHGIAESDARVLIAKQIQNIPHIYGNRGNLSQNHREISKPNQNNEKSLREREGEREERT